MTTKEQILFLNRVLQKEPLDLLWVAATLKLSARFHVRIDIQDVFVYSTYCVLCVQAEGKVRSNDRFANFEEVFISALKKYLQPYFEKWMNLKKEVRINISTYEVHYQGRN
jgi:hypothetical protein